MFVDNYAEAKENGTIIKQNKKEEVVAVKNDYKRYRELGGIINEADYASALARTKEKVIVNELFAKHAKNMARVAGIVLDEKDSRAILYGILRGDTETNVSEKKQKENKEIKTDESVHRDNNSVLKKKETEGYLSQMSDQKIFVEALRMLGDEDALKKCIEAYPNISFNYAHEDKT
jgi:hypothetical protein